ncbi:MAG TPA: hypothetical protein VIW69_02420, partial [Candidatus Elarobacter sp.]
MKRRTLLGGAMATALLPACSSGRRAGVIGISRDALSNLAGSFICAPLRIDEADKAYLERLSALAPAGIVYFEAPLFTCFSRQSRELLVQRFALFDDGDGVVDAP